MHTSFRFAAGFGVINVWLRLTAALCEVVVRSNYTLLILMIIFSFRCGLELSLLTRVNCVLYVMVFYMWDKSAERE
jgi:hypothetical protein